MQRRRRLCNFLPSQCVALQRRHYCDIVDAEMWYVLQRCPKTSSTQMSKQCINTVLWEEPNGVRTLLKREWELEWIGYNSHFDTTRSTFKLGKQSSRDHSQSNNQYLPTSIVDTCLYIVIIVVKHFILLTHMECKMKHNVGKPIQ